MLKNKKEQQQFEEKCRYQVDDWVNQLHGRFFSFGLPSDFFLFMDNVLAHVIFNVHRRYLKEDKVAETIDVFMEELTQTLNGIKKEYARIKKETH